MLLCFSLWASNTTATLRVFRAKWLFVTFWLSIEFFEKWFNMLVPAFAKLIFFKPNQPVFLCVAVLQLVGLRHNGHSSGFSCGMIICDVLIGWSCSGDGQPATLITSVEIWSILLSDLLSRFLRWNYNVHAGSDEISRVKLFSCTCTTSMLLFSVPSHADNYIRLHGFGPASSDSFSLLKVIMAWGRERTKLYCHW